MKLMTATFMAALMMMSMRADAQIAPGTHQLSLGLGLANPISHQTVDGERAAYGEMGPAIGFTYLYQLRRHLSFGADLNIKNLGDKDIRTGHGPAEVGSSAWTMMAIARGDFLPDSNVRPYGLLGLGIGGAKREVEFSQDPRFNRDSSSSGIAFGLGGGLDFDLNQSWVAGAELRYNIIDTDADEVGTDTVRTIDLMFKVGYKF